MSLRFEDVIPTLLACVADDPSEPSLDRIGVVRDLRARVRLVLKPNIGTSVDVGALEQRLKAALGGWFCGPILVTTSAKKPEATLAQTLLDQAEPWPSSWAQVWIGALGEPTAFPGRPDRLRSIQRVHSKQAWLTNRPGSPPWPLVGSAPAIVSFYSFKGGVGRSTCLGVVAWQLARAGKKVICIDLDIEAPGLAKLFEVSEDGPGVLDELLTYGASGKLSERDLVQNVTLRAGATIGVVPAGALDSNYIEKLARLDFTSSGDGTDGPSPVEQGLRDLLKFIRSKHRPDYIFLDNRAGLHDLGGMSLNDLPHVDVLVGRSGRQGLAGLEVALGVLHRRRPIRERRIAVVQTIVPLDPAVRPTAEGDYRRQVYELFARQMYLEEDDPLEPEATNPSSPDNPIVTTGFDEGDALQPEDTTAAHYPVSIGRYDELASADVLSGVSPSVLDNEDFTRLRKRVEELCSTDGETPPETHREGDAP
jgi:cellulose biosynthesis protein BcsQ